MEKKQTQRKLTLCDLCVLAAFILLAVSLVQPPVTQAFEDKKLETLADRLQAIRSQIRLYKADTGILPGQQGDDTAATADAFVEALTQRQGRDKALYGQAFPANPYVETEAARRITCVNDPNAQPTGLEATGWWYNAATGDFAACDSAFHTNY